MIVTKEKQFSQSNQQQSNKEIPNLNVQNVSSQLNEESPPPPPPSKEPKYSNVQKSNLLLLDKLLTSDVDENCIIDGEVNEDADNLMISFANNEKESGDWPTLTDQGK